MSTQFPIADAHQHFWDPRVNYHPWLCDPPPVPFRYGDYSALRRPYLPADRSAEGIAGWKRALHALAACPNAAIKISGIGVRGTRWTPALNREVVLAAIEIFGARRALFASNFPVDGLCAGFDEIYCGFREIVKGFSALEQRALFHDNAVRIYAME